VRWFSCLTFIVGIASPRQGYYYVAPFCFVCLILILVCMHALQFDQSIYVFKSVYKRDGSLLRLFCLVLENEQQNKQTKNNAVGFHT
jgi:hypothetical protein